MQVLGLTSSSGLELKSDPGVPVVYAGFAFLMLTTILSYVSHSQVWAVGTGNGTEMGAETSLLPQLAIGGKTNRAKKEFQNEVDTILKELLTRG